MIQIAKNIQRCSLCGNKRHVLSNGLCVHCNSKIIDDVYYVSQYSKDDYYLDTPGYYDYTNGRISLGDGCYKKSTKNSY